MALAARSVLACWVSATILKAASDIERLGLVDALKSGVERTWFIVETTFRYLASW